MRLIFDCLIFVFLWSALAFAAFSVSPFVGWCVVVLGVLVFVRGLLD